MIGKRPDVPIESPPEYTELIHLCWVRPLCTVRSNATSISHLKRDPRGPRSLIHSPGCNALRASWSVH